MKNNQQLEPNGYYWIKVNKYDPEIAKYTGTHFQRLWPNTMIEADKCKVLSEIILRPTEV